MASPLVFLYSVTPGVRYLNPFTFLGYHPLGRDVLDSSWLISSAGPFLRDGGL
jgi:hypothetical protein